MDDGLNRAQPHLPNGTPSLLRTRSLLRTHREIVNLLDEIGYTVEQVHSIARIRLSVIAQR